MLTPSFKIIPTIIGAMKPVAEPIVLVIPKMVPDMSGAISETIGMSPPAFPPKANIEATKSNLINDGSNGKCAMATRVTEGTRRAGKYNIIKKNK